MPLHASGYRRGIVAAPHRAAAEAGRQILAEGGNALEAMVAMAAAIAAVYPHMNHIGGDGFFLVREPSGRIRAIMGAGPAGPAPRSRRSRFRAPPAPGSWRSKPPGHRAGACRLPPCSPPPFVTSKTTS